MKSITTLLLALCSLACAHAQTVAYEAIVGQHLIYNSLDCAELPSGDLVFMGLEGFGYPSEMNLVRSNSIGDKIWELELPWSFNDVPVHHGLEVLNDSTFYVLSSTTNQDSTPLNWMLTIINGGGSLATTVQYGGPSTDFATGIVATEDNGLLLCGSMLGTSSVDGVVIKTDHWGVEQWRISWPVGNSSEAPQRLVPMANNRFAVLSMLADTGAGKLLDVRMINSVGDELDHGQVSIPGYQHIGQAIVNRNDQLLLVSNSAALGNYQSMAVSKITPDFELTWHYDLPLDTMYRSASAICETPDGGYMISGARRHVSQTFPEDLVIRLDSEGNELWKDAIVGNSELRQWFTTAEFMYQQRYRFTGFIRQTDGFFSWNRYWQVEMIDLSVGINETVAATPAPVRVWPQPATDRVQFELEATTGGSSTLTVFDLSGTVVAQKRFEARNPGINRYEWTPSSELAAGMYVYQLNIGQQLSTGKLTINR